MYCTDQLVICFLPSEARCPGHMCPSTGWTLIQSQNYDNQHLSWENNWIQDTLSEKNESHPLLKVRGFWKILILKIWCLCFLHEFLSFESFWCTQAWFPGHCSWLGSWFFCYYHLLPAAWFPSPDCRGIYCFWLQAGKFPISTEAKFWLWFVSDCVIRVLGLPLQEEKRANLDPRSIQRSHSMMTDRYIDR